MKRLFLILQIHLLCGFAVSAHQTSLEELDSLLLSKNISEADKSNIIERLLPMVKNIEHQHIMDIAFTLPRTFLPLNPSIVKTDNGYDVICRTSNFGPPQYAAFIPGDVNRSKSFFLRYDKNFKLLYEQEMHIPPDLAKSLGICEDHAFQDGRIFHWNGACWFLAVVSLKSHWYLPKLALGKFDCYNNDRYPVGLQSLTVFYGPQHELFEKNWMTVIDDAGKLLFIYSYDPFILLEPNIENGKCDVVLSYLPPLDFSRFHGSAAPIDLGDGYLMMVHENLNKRRYVHRFLYLDRKFRITKISLPFVFTHLGIEFCASMTLDHSGKNLVTGVGIQDKEAKLITLDLEYVKGLLHDI